MAYTWSINLFKSVYRWFLAQRAAEQAKRAAEQAKRAAEYARRLKNSLKKMSGPPKYGEKGYKAWRLKAKAAANAKAAAAKAKALR